MEYKNCGRKIELVGRTNEEIPSNSLISSMHRDNLKGHRSVNVHANNIIVVVRILQYNII